MREPIARREASPPEEMTMMIATFVKRWATKPATATTAPIHETRTR